MRVGQVGLCLEEFAQYAGLVRDGVQLISGLDPGHEDVIHTRAGVLFSEAMRVVLDTNVWSWLADLDLGSTMAELEEATGINLVVPPSVLLEVLRTPNERAREQIVQVLTQRTRSHPPPEAYFESEELVAEVRRCRAGWLRARPMTDRLPPLLNFWTKGLWVQAKRNSAAVACRLASMEESLGFGQQLDRLVQTEKVNRRMFLEQGFSATGEWVTALHVDVGSADLDEHPTIREGWGGRPVEAWRVEASDLFWRELTVVPRRRHRTGEDSTFADWCLPWLDRYLMSNDRADWNRFWYYDVEMRNMPRNWLRTYVRLAQYGTKVGSGNPVDEQHSSYLVDADLLISADRRYCSVLESLAKFAPVPIASARLVRDKCHGLVEEIGRIVASSEKPT